MGKISGDTTLNIGVIHGGLAANIVPDLCTVSGEVRGHLHEKVLEIVETVKMEFDSSANAIGATVDFDLQTGCKAYATPMNHPVIKRFEKVCGELKLPFLPVKTFGGSDNNILAEHGISGIVLASAMNQCHSCEEYTSIEELMRAAELTLSLMTK